MVNYIPPAYLLVKYQRAVEKENISCLASIFYHSIYALLVGFCMGQAFVKGRETTLLYASYIVRIFSQTGFFNCHESDPPNFQN